MAERPPAIASAIDADEERRLRRRLRFDEAAELYARVRPGYVDAMFDDVWRLASLSGRPHVLEIGCGTGQATLPMLRRGASVLAVEIGPALAELARDATRSHGDRIEVVTADFDRWTPPGPPADLVVVATAFHWLERHRRCERIARCLGDGGMLAVVSNEHVSDEAGDEFFVRSQDAYREAFGGTRVRFPALGSLKPVDLDDAVFEVAAHRTYAWTQSFDTASYLETLATYSDHRDLPDTARERLLGRLGGADRRHGGHARQALGDDADFGKTSFAVRIVLISAPRPRVRHGREPQSVH